MIEKVINRKNMLKAYRQVLSNKGSAGVDGMSVKELSSHLKENRDTIVTAVCNGKY
jgi:RNA-directed DNA polymerase